MLDIKKGAASVVFAVVFVSTALLPALDNGGGGRIHHCLYYRWGHGPSVYRGEKR